MYMSNVNTENKYLFTFSVYKDKDSIIGDSDHHLITLPDDYECRK